MLSQTQFWSRKLADMTQKFQSHYQMADGNTPLASSFFNLVFSDLDQRLHAQEVMEKDWRAALDVLSEFGLERIDQTLAPLLTQFQEIANFGFMTATLQGDDAIIFDLGEKTVQIAEGSERTYFAVSPFVAVQSSGDPEYYAIARCLEYDRETGALLIDILSRSAALDGDPGPHAGVTVSVLPGGWGALHMLVENARNHRLAAELSAASAYTSAATAQVLANTSEDLRDQTEAARDAVLEVLPEGTIPLLREMTAESTINMPSGAVWMDNIAFAGKATLPKLVSISLVCKGADLGYEVGDIVPISAFPGGASPADLPGLSFFMRIITGNAFILAMSSAEGSPLRLRSVVGGLVGAPAAINPAKWRIRVTGWW